MLKRLVLLLFLIVPVQSLQAAAGTSAADLIEARLRMMKAVAAHKLERDLPVEDRAREARVLQAAVRAGLEQGLTRHSVAALFRAQMDAAREIQHYWLDRWSGDAGPPAHSPDLETEIRPRLIELGRQIVSAAASPDRGAVGQIEVEGLTATSRERIAGALEALSFYPDRLTQILDSGMLRIGTTGDYPPFSLRQAGEETYSGIDIDQGRDLALALGVEPVFVETSWPSLMADLGAGRFDIAMGGVSRTLERQREGFFSRPYHAGGKTAIGRCGDGERFATLSAIDRPGVRVVVNPGGTNERFVDARIGEAEKIVHRDNRTIFSLLLKGEADVMITDRIEADWQAMRHPRLCTPVPGNFTYQEKAYLMPRDIALKAFVDTWLDLRIAGGKLSPLLSVD